MKFSIYTLLFISNFIFFSLSGQTWLGNNSNWNDPINWSSGSVPTAADDVTIPSTANNPIISGAVPDVGSIDIQPTVTLTIGNSGNLTVVDENSSGFSIEIDEANLIVNGNLNIHPTSSDVNGIRLNGNLTVSGIIDFSEASGGDISMCIETTNVTTSTELTVNIGGEIIATGVGNELLEFDSGGTSTSVTNNGTLRYINNGEDEMIRLDDADNFINNGLMECMRDSNSGDEGLEIGGDVTFINNGIIRIDNYSMSIDIDQPGATFTNNGRIEITNSGSESITVNTNSTFINSNDPNAAILLDFTLDINGTFTNDGYMSLGSGDLDVDGTFTNSMTGYICDPNDLVANSIGAGTVNDNGTTETGVCLPAPPPPRLAQIPTLSQWGIIILSLAFFCIGVVSLRRKVLDLA